MTERPFRISQELASLQRKDVIERLIERYRLAYKLGYSKKNSGGLGNKPTGHSDPTGEIITEQKRHRDKVELAGRAIMEMCKNFDLADSHLADLVERAGPYERVQHRAGEQPMYPEEVQAGKRVMRRIVGRKGRGAE